MTAAGGEPLAPEAVQMLEYLRSRAAAMTPAGIRERVRAAAVTDEDARRRPIPDKWTIAEVVDHIAQTQIRGAEELRHLLAGRRPPGPPVYEALRTGASQWAPWAELKEGLHEANQEMVALLETNPAAVDPPPTVRTILVANPVTPQIFVAELGWKEYALLQRLHLLDHRTQVKNLKAALALRD